MVDRQFIVRRAGQKANVLTASGNPMASSMRSKSDASIRSWALSRDPRLRALRRRGRRRAASIGDLEIGLQAALGKPSSRRRLPTARARNGETKCRCRAYWAIRGRFPMAARRQSARLGHPCAGSARLARSYVSTPRASSRFSRRAGSQHEISKGLSCPGRRLDRQDADPLGLLAAQRILDETGHGLLLAARFIAQFTALQAAATGPSQAHRPTPVGIALPRHWLAPRGFQSNFVQLPDSKRGRKVG